MTSPRIVQINVSSGGIPKKPVPVGRVTFSRIAGDDWNDKKHHGARDQAVLLISLEKLEELKREGFPLYPGALGENFTTSGLDFGGVRIGQVYRAGETALIRISRVRIPCRTIAVYGQGILRATFDEAVRAGDSQSPRWGRSGFYAEVLREGTVLPGDPLILQDGGEPDERSTNL